MSDKREGAGHDSTLLSEPADLGSEETLAADTASPISPRARAPGGGGDVTSADRDFDTLQPVDPDSYVFGRWFASGGMGRIAEVRDRRLGRVVALKELINPDPTMIERFKREVYITARLQHPAIVPVHEAGVWPGGEPFLVMKRVEGESLKEVLARTETFAERLELLSRVITIADALAHAHERQVIHRDVKPSNVLVGEHGETVVIDWGLAIAVGSDAELDAAMSPIAGSGSSVTAVGSVVGTPAYMAPEQARGEPADTRSDVYAIGAILYEVLSGSPPYSGADASVILEQVLEGEPDPLPAEVPGDLATIVATAMARDPGDRYPSAVELADDLRRFRTGRLVAAHRYSAAERFARWVRRHRAAVVVAVIGIVAVAALSVVSVSRIIDERDQATAARAEAQSRADRLTVTQARSLAAADPVGALRLLATLPPESPQWSAGRLVTADAVASGIPELFEAPLSDADRFELSPDGRSAYLVRGAEVIRHDLESGESRPLGAHGSAIIELELGGDGAIVVAGGTDGATTVWSRRGEKLARVGGHDGWIEDVYISPTGAHLITAGLDRTTRIWEVASEKQIAALPRLLTAVSFSADGRKMAALDVGRGAEQQVAVYDLGTGVETLIPKALGAFTALSLSPDGARVVTGDRAGTIRLWTIATGEVRDLGAQDGVAGDVVFSPDGARIASAASSGTVTVWSVADGGSPWIYAGAGGAVRRLGFSRDGAHLLARAADGDLHVLSPGRRRGRRLAGALSAPVFAGDSIVAVAGRDRVGRWPITSGGERVFDSGQRIDGVGFSPDGSAIAGPGPGWSLRVWDTASGEHRDLRGHAAAVVAAAISPNGALAASVDADKRVRLWHLVSGASIELRGRALGPPRFSPDGSRLAAAGDDLTVRSWDLETGALRSLSGHRGWVVTCAFGPGVLASAGSAGEVRVWDLDTGESKVIGEHEARPTELVVSPSGDRVVVGDEAGELRWWSTRGAPAIEAAAHRSWVTALAVAADGTVASGGADGVVRLWDRRGVELRSLEGHVGQVWALDFSGDGRSLVSGGSDGDARIWDRGSGAHRILSGHRGLIHVARFSPAGDRLATAGVDGTIRLWRDDLPREPAALRRWIEGVLARSR